MKKNCKLLPLLELKRERAIFRTQDIAAGWVVGQKLYPLISRGHSYGQKELSRDGVGGINT